MNYLLDLYSENIYSQTEEKQNERRFVFAVILALLIHIGLFIGIGMSSLLNYKRPEEIKIINVQLHSDETAPAARTAKGKPDKQKKTHTETKSVKAAENQATKKSNNINNIKETTPQKQSKTAQTTAQQTAPAEAVKHSETVTAQKTQETPADSSTIMPSPPPPLPSDTAAAAETSQPVVQQQPDIFEQMTRAADTRAAETRQQWADAHQTPAQQQETAEDAAARETIRNISTAGGGSAAAQSDGKYNQTEETAAADGEAAPNGNNIRWTTGTSRRLISSGEIVPPDEIAVLGLKTAVTIRFEVFDNGLIGKVEIVKSSGETEWDNDVAQQFKTKYKFEQGSGKAVGTIIINMGY